MRGRSYSTLSPPRGYRRRGRSPGLRGRGSRDRDLSFSILIRILPYDCRQEDLRRPFEQFGSLMDIYLPRDYITRRNRFHDRRSSPARYSRSPPPRRGRRSRSRRRSYNSPPLERHQSRRNRFHDRRRSPARISRSPPPSRGSRSRSRSYISPPPSRGSRSRSRSYISPPLRHQSRYVSPQGRRYDNERSYSRSLSHNGSRVRNESPGIVKSHSGSPRRSVSPRRIRNDTPELQARSDTPELQARSDTPEQARSDTPEQTRSDTPEDPCILCHLMLLDLI